MKENIAAVVVLYNPDRHFTSNIFTYINYVSLLVIVDNSENPDHAFYQAFREYQHVRFVINNENTGIAKAINSGVAMAHADGFEWALLMDQDSFFDDGMIKKYMSSFAEMPGKDSIAVIGPVTDKKIGSHTNSATKKVISLITSGSIVNISVFNAAGGYNEKLFIDEVDHEYCYRAGLKGFSTYQFQEVFLEHALGKDAYVTTISGEKKIKSFHSPLRLYYIVRNCCYVISKYKKLLPGEIKVKRKDLLVRIKNNFLYGTKRFAVLKYMLLGFIHYKTNRFGKL